MLRATILFYSDPDPGTLTAFEPDIFTSPYPDLIEIFSSEILLLMQKNDIKICRTFKVSVKLKRL